MWGYDKMALGQIFEAILGQYRKIPFSKAPLIFSVVIMNVCVNASWCILWHACRSGKAFGSWFSYFQCIFLGSNSGLKACMVGAFTKWAISPSYNAYYFSSFVIKVYVYAHVEVRENLCGINSILPNIKLRLPGLWGKFFNLWAILRLKTTRGLERGLSV